MDWEIKRNEFYDIDPFDNSPDEIKRLLIFDQEDMLWIKKGDYNIDLGWYGGNNLNNRQTGYCIHLFRGAHWNKCELLEKSRSKNKEDIVNKLNFFINSIERGDYNYLSGYNINEDDLMNKNLISDLDEYSAKKRSPGLC